MTKKGKPSDKANINVSGTYVGGKVNISGGDFVGRDQFLTIGSNAAELSQLFEKLYAAIEARSNTSAATKANLKAEVQEVQKELAKGIKANEGFLARRLHNIQRMAPDILEVVITTLTNSAAGLGEVMKKIAQRMKESAHGQ